jgi:hypothetical protein
MRGQRPNILLGAAVSMHSNVNEPGPTLDGSAYHEVHRRQLVNADRRSTSSQYTHVTIAGASESQKRPSQAERVRDNCCTS